MPAPIAQIRDNQKAIISPMDKIPKTAELYHANDHLHAATVTSMHKQQLPIAQAQPCYLMSHCN